MTLDIFYYIMKYRSEAAQPPPDTKYKSDPAQPQPRAARLVPTAPHAAHAALQRSTPGRFLRTEFYTDRAPGTGARQKTFPCRTQKTCFSLPKPLPHAKACFSLLKPLPHAKACFSFLKPHAATPRIKKQTRRCGGSACTQRVRPKNRRFEKILFERMVLS